MPIAPRAAASYTRPEMPRREALMKQRWAGWQRRAYKLPPHAPVGLRAPIPEIENAFSHCAGSGPPGVDRPAIDRSTYDRQRMARPSHGSTPP
jgi:hypothetical protein